MKVQGSMSRIVNPCLEQRMLYRMPGIFSVEAMKWCLLASATFGNDATQWIEAHEKDLTSGQNAEARARAEAFRTQQQKMIR